MPRTLIFAIFVSVIAATTVRAQLPPQPPPVSNPLGQGLLGQGSEQERAACYPDVQAFCGPLARDPDRADPFAILSCLQTNRTRISGACRGVLDSHGV
jgi:hypothetical protein